jgi:hypothetical protein
MNTGHPNKPMQATRWTASLMGGVLPTEMRKEKEENDAAQ